MDDSETKMMMIMGFILGRGFFCLIDEECEIWEAHDKGGKTIHRSNEVCRAVAFYVLRICPICFPIFLFVFSAHKKHLFVFIVSS